MSEPTLAPIYVALRAEALSWGPKEIKAPPVVEDGEVLGVVMDIGYDEAVVTVVGLAEGTTSIYASTGAAKIGMGAHQHVATTSKAWIAVAEAAPVNASEATELPVAGAVQFTLLTTGAKRSATADEAALQAGNHPLSDLYTAGQDVIGAIRAVDEGE
ncbi:MAG: hypothetical protein F2663_01935 [Actinobacteria bacterium]|uniref:Unannotated protein n=1 Tax=freshwater metagenome TaxID=449393 RepID=A0A6J6NIL0_9ZZZZ|nr:hypothetical protein [Actinomycetota bacterium]